ncbi:hypothetical protein [Streptomyces sp. NPDC007206]|uniref:hypothetical protein n=1 Tax=Streptomyces sp. NPDC007206 TaxID=3154317 RepID=UPI0033C161A1
MCREEWSRRPALDRPRVPASKHPGRSPHRRTGGQAAPACRESRHDDLLHYTKARDQWERRSCGDCAKGERLYNWTACAVQVKDENPADGHAHWLVLRRSLHLNRHGKDGQLHRKIAYLPGLLPPGLQP